MGEYTKVHAAWADYPDTSTPLTATALDTIEEGIADAVAKDAVTVAGTRLVSTSLLAADAYPAFKIMGDGDMYWGAGGASDFDVNLYRYAANILGSDDRILVARSTSSDIAYDARVEPGDTAARFQMRADGYMAWGSGSAALDTVLYRVAASILGTDDRFIVIRATTADVAHDVRTSGDSTGRFTINASGSIQWGPGNAATDCSLQRISAAYLQTESRLAFSRAATADVVINSLVAGDANSRFYINAAGQMFWGPATATQDTNLFRAGADTLKTDDGLWAAGGLATKTKAGIPSDSDLSATMQQSGAFILDTTNSRIYFRVGTTWKYAALT